jgi:amino acid transporter
MAGDNSGHELKRELGLGDLAAMQVLLIVGVAWAGQAAKLGGTQVIFWAAAALLFFVPTASVVSYCAGLWPQEGGVYQWVRHTFGPFAGFLSAWNFVIWALLTSSYVGIQTATSMAYGLGPQAAWMGDSHPLIVWLTVGLFAAILLLNLPGFAIGKWVGHLGTATLIGVSLILTVLLVWHPHATAVHPHISPQRPFVLGLPAMSLLTLNLFTKIAFNGFTGIEQVAVFAGETRNPSRTILRSVWLAVPVIILIYVLNTGSILTYVPVKDVDLTGPLPQVLAAAFGTAQGGGLDVGLLLGRFAILALAVGVFAQDVVCLAEASRLPLVAGWDGILPEWFTRLHPRWKTPTRSIAVMVAVALAAGLLATSGAGKQEAFQLLQTSGNLSYGLYFGLMLAIPLVAGKRFAKRPGLWCRIGAVCALVITLGAMGLNLVPIVEVKSVWLFAAEVLGTFVILNALGGLVYWSGTRTKSD